MRGIRLADLAAVGVLMSVRQRVVNQFCSRYDQYEYLVEKEACAPRVILSVSSPLRPTWRRRERSVHPQADIE